MSWQEQAEIFLNISSQFKLGHLTTETPHPETRHLSTLAQNDLSSAFTLLKNIDQQALEKMVHHLPQFFKLSIQAQKVLARGNKVFMSGCGATGRLSLVVETLSRQMNHYPNQIIGFMAGGDYALIKSVESFEDRMDYGEKQLIELGFKDGDMLMAITEGGETPFVIATALKACEISKEKVAFLYCNPDHELKSIDRSLKVLEHPQIEKLNLTVGSMALTGSTRMQASTVLMLAAGFITLYPWKSHDEISAKLKTLQHDFNSIDYQKIFPLTLWEEERVKKGELINYCSSSDIAISVLTDTTERSPTFSQSPFENKRHPNQPKSLSYLFVQNTTTSKEAWRELLKRAPRTLSWDEVKVQIDDEELYGFDLSNQGLLQRKGQNLHLNFNQSALILKSTDLEVNLPLKNSDPLWIHLVLKMLLNAHSTLLMGRLGFFQDNIMTWVKASNNKLVDRATRYILLLGKNQGHIWDYQEVVKNIFKLQEITSSTPIVLRVLEEMKKN
jgi:N-acetylmuramic acid 6-phosphate etherase